MRNLKIELLYFESCPSWKMAKESLEAILQDSNIEATVQLVRVETDQEAKDHRFVGSPSIRVNKDDLFPAKMIEDALTARLS